MMGWDFIGGSVIDGNVCNGDVEVKHKNQRILVSVDMS